MGNQNAKNKDKIRLSDQELKIMESTFRTACGPLTDKLTKDKMLECWNQIIDAHLTECTVNFLFSPPAPGETKPVTYITPALFVEPYYYVQHGTIEEKLNFLCASIEKRDANQLALKELENYISSVMKSYLQMLRDEQSDAAFKSWNTHGYQWSERTVLGFAKGLLRSISKLGAHSVYLEEVERWMQEHPSFILIWKDVFCYMYSKHAGRSQRLKNSSGSSLNILPVLEGLTKDSHYAPVLELPHVIFINSNLPNSMRHKWRFLFSSKIMGESFSTMIGKMMQKGPTLVVVEDEDRYIFGGYAPESWALRPVFVGDDTSMLFTLSPAMRCFNATGYNNHYQYLNLKQQTMPNGLGMGGQFNFWGLWIDSTYGLGHSSESCTTYRDYVQLSKRKEFHIRNIEVWGIGDEPKLDLDSDGEDGKTKRSVLDKNLEDQVMLELSGHKMHSAGLREPDMDL